MSSRFISNPSHQLRFFTQTMNRGRNRQARPPRQNAHGGSAGQGRGRGRGDGPPPPGAGGVPTVQQVVPGAGVSIVLKQDQATGEETQGFVQDLLTRGNHPRGIKVRLRDGQVGRVQRMVGGDGGGGGGGGGDGNGRSAATSAAATTTTATATGASLSSRFSHKYTDVRNEPDNPSELPPRSLADFMPVSFQEPQEPADQGPAAEGAVFSQANASCPFCEAFQGDEAAVTHHIDQEHLV